MKWLNEKSIYDNSSCMKFLLSFVLSNKIFFIEIKPLGFITKKLISKTLFSLGFTLIAFL